jgi:MFS family permease
MPVQMPGQPGAYGAPTNGAPTNGAAGNGAAPYGNGAPQYGQPGMPPPPPGWRPGMPVYGMPGQAGAVATAPTRWARTADAPPTLSERAYDSIVRLRQIFQIPTLKRVILGEAILFASFSGLFSFATSFIAETYFDNPATEDDTEGSAKASLLVAGVSTPFIAAGAVIGSYIDRKYSQQDPALRIRVGVIALLVGAVAIAGYIVSDPIQLRLGFFYIFAGVNIIAVSNLAAATADSIPARIRGSGFAILQVCLAAGGSFGPLVVGLGSALGGEDKRWGFAALFIPLLIGAAVVWTARSTYPTDAAQVVSEAAGGPPRTDPLEGSSTNSNAIKSAVAGFCCVLTFIVSFIVPIVALIGLVFGFRALNEIKARPQYGRGLALTGIYLSAILGGLGVVRLIISIITGDFGPPGGDE